jgi:RNA polymerase-binding protein DksA
MQNTYNPPKIKRKLEKQRANLLAFLNRKQPLTTAVDVSNPGKADHAVISRNKNREILLVDHIQGQLADVDQALKRLETGTYGICANCREKIQPERLEIMPTAVLCIECQRIQDQKTR